MQKAISIDQNRVVSRILTVADISSVDNSPNGLTYIPVEWVDAPTIDKAKEVAYPMYNTETQTMFWQVVEYQITASTQLIENLNLKAQISELTTSLEETKTELATTQEALDALLMGEASE